MTLQKDLTKSRTRLKKKTSSGDSLLTFPHSKDIEKILKSSIKKSKSDFSYTTLDSKKLICSTSIMLILLNSFFSWSFFWGGCYTCGIWRLLGHSSNLRHSSDYTISLAHRAIRELPLFYFLKVCLV